MAYDESTITCMKHGDVLDMFCEDCELEICLICGQQDHASHKWHRAVKVIDCVKSKIRGHCDILRQIQIPQLEAQVQKINIMKAENERLISIQISNILMQTEKLAKRMSNISDQQIKYCKAVKEEVDGKLDLKEKEIQTYISQFESIVGKMEEGNITDISKILQMKKQVSLIPEPLKFSDEDVTLQKVEFKEVTPREKILQSMIGELSLKYKSITLTQLFASKRGEKHIKYISPVTESTAWYREFQSLDNILIDIRNERSEIGYSFGKSTPLPENLITLKDGVLVYTSHVGQCVMKLSAMDNISTGAESFEKVVKVADTSPLFPLDICDSAAGYFLLTAMDKKVFNKDLYTKTPPQQSVVIVLSYTGKTKKVYQFEEDEKTPLFLFPYTLSENKNRDICVVNRTASNSGHVCVLSSSGKLKFKYRGPKPDLLPFAPYGICCDAQSNILISDCENNSVHLLSENGEFLTYLIKGKGELRSMYMSFNILWMGGKDGFIYAYRYEIDTSDS